MKKEKMNKVINQRKYKITGLFINPACDHFYFSYSPYSRPFLPKDGSQVITPSYTTVLFGVQLFQKTTIP